MRLRSRRGVAGRRPDPARRPPRALPWSRILGSLALLGVSGALYWLATDPTFAVDPAHVPVSGARYTDRGAILKRMGLDGATRPDIFRVATAEMALAVEGLPAVRDARVTATLPDRVEVQVTERTPILVWRAGEAGWLVDVEGVLFAPANAASAAELGDGATGSSLPAVEDRRKRASPWALGDRLLALDLSVVRLLGTLTPADVGSSADRLRLRVDDRDGYVLEAPGRWLAIFGHYTPSLAGADRIPRQAQCLGALLAGREKSVARVLLTLGVDRCGTFTVGPDPKPTPAPTPAPTPGRTAGHKTPAPHGAGQRTPRP